MIIAMATPAWWVSVEDSTSGGVAGTWTYSFGLKTWEIVGVFGTSTQITSGKLSEPPSPYLADLYGRFDSGGTDLIITGTLCLVATTIAFILCFMYVCAGPRPGKFLFFGVFFGLAAGVTNIIGIMIYSKAFNVGVSFLLFIGGAFVFFGATATLVASYAVDGATNPGRYEQQKDDAVPTATTAGPSADEEV